MKKIFRKALCLAMATAIVILVGMKTGALKEFSGVTVQAAYPEVSDVVVTGFTDSTITISWQGDVDASIYEISYSVYYEGDTGDKIAGQTTSTTYTISGLKSGSVYDIRVTPKNTMGEEGFSGYCSEVKTKVSVMKGLKQNTWYHYIEKADVSWQRQYAADGYEYRWKNSAGKVIKKGKTKDTWLDFSVKNNNVYQLMVRAYQKINGNTYYTPWKTIRVFEQPWVKSVAVKKNKKSIKQLKISWYKQKGATGYDVYVSKTNKAKSYKKVKSVGKKTTSIAISKFKGKKIKGTYYVYVVSKVKTSNGISKSGVVYMWKTGQTGEGYVS